MKRSGEPCIRAMDKRIIAWCTGMTEAEIDEMIKKYVADGAHRSLAAYDEKEGITA